MSRNTSAFCVTERVFCPATHTDTPTHGKLPRKDLFLNRQDSWANLRSTSSKHARCMLSTHAPGA